MLLNSMANKLFILGGRGDPQSIKYIEEDIKSLKALLLVLPD